MEVKEEHHQQDNIYDEWNALKKQLNKRAQTVYFREREIWFCSIGTNIGHEQNGKHALFERPILIIKKLSSQLFIAAPFTSKVRSGYFCYPVFHDGREFTLLLSQIRVLDARRLQRRLYRLTKGELEGIKTFLKTKI